MLAIGRPLAALLRRRDSIQSLGTTSWLADVQRVPQRRHLDTSLSDVQSHVNSRLQLPPYDSSHEFLESASILPVNQIRWHTPFNQNHTVTRFRDSDLSYRFVISCPLPDLSYLPTAAHTERRRAADLGHVPGHNALRQPLGDGRLAHAGLPDEARVVLGPPRQHPHLPRQYHDSSLSHVDIPMHVSTMISY
jgi:hypothetical protein